MSSESLRARYGASAPALAVSNPVVEGLLGHRSVRAFLPEALPEGTLETLVAAAQSASSSSNLQVWSVVAVEDPVHKAELSVLANNQAFIREAPLFLVWVADFARVQLLAKGAGAVIEGPEYTEMLITGIVDAALAAQNALVAAEALGLGGVYVGAVRDHVEGVAGALNLPPHVFPVFGMAIGRPDPARPAQVKPRLPQAAVLHRETYDAGPQPAAADAYNETFKAFWQSQGMAHPDWIRQVLNRLKDGAALRNRAFIRESLARLGFPLR